MQQQLLLLLHLVALWFESPAQLTGCGGGRNIAFFHFMHSTCVRNSDSRHLVQLCAILRLQKVRQAAVSAESEQMIAVYRSSVTVQLCFGSFVLSVSLGLLLLAEQTEITKLSRLYGYWFVSW